MAKLRLDLSVLGGLSGLVEDSSLTFSIETIPTTPSQNAKKSLLEESET